MNKLSDNYEGTCSLSKGKSGAQKKEKNQEEREEEPAIQ